MGNGQNQTTEDIDRVMNWAADRIDNGTCYRGMSYEEGVMNAIRWMSGEEDAPPPDEE